MLLPKGWDGFCHGLQITALHSPSHSNTHFYYPHYFHSPSEGWELHPPPEGCLGSIAVFSFPVILVLCPGIK